MLERPSVHSEIFGQKKTVLEMLKYYSFKEDFQNTYVCLKGKKS